MAKFTLKRLKIAYHLAKSFKGQTTKFGYACLKSTSLIESAIKKQEEELSDKQNELASVDDKTKNLVLGDKGEYTYTAKSDKALKDFIVNQNEKEVEYEPYFSVNFDEIKDNLDIIDALNGIIVDVDIDKYIESRQQEPIK